jgi:uncharacterized protein (TIGR02444 family)
MRRGDDGVLDLEGAHWSFVVDLYQRPGVSRACLLLQDVLGADVCLVLFALFVAREHRAILNKGSLEDLDRAIADWRGEVVRPLRAIRRRLKTGPMPAPDPATHALLQQIKAAEINAEQIELALLARHFHRRGHAVSAETIDVMTVLDGIVVFFAAQGETSAADVPEIRAALRDIAHAVAQP